MTTTFDAQSPLAGHAETLAEMLQQSPGLQSHEIAAAKAGIEALTRLASPPIITDPLPWVSRINPTLRGESPDYFPERILTHGVDYAPRPEFSTAPDEYGTARSLAAKALLELLVEAIAHIANPVSSTKIWTTKALHHAHALAALVPAGKE